MEGYSVKIKECSIELSAKERIQFKDTSNASKLDELTAEGVKVTLHPAYYGTLAIHNEKSEDKDYEQFVLVDSEGHKYVTGSKSFISAFTDIAEEMKDETDAWAIEVYKLPSKNYKGKDFLTCSII